MKKTFLINLVFISISAVTQGMELQLNDAILKGNTETMLSLLSNGGMINRQDHEGNTWLHKASERGCETIVRFLLGNGADPNIRNKNGDAALHRAIEHGYTASALELLKDVRTWPNAQNNNGDTAFHRAATHGLREVVQALLGREANPNLRNGDLDTALLRAIEDGHEDVALLFLSISDVHARNKYGDAAVHRAAHHGLHSIIDKLLAFRVDINVRNGCGNTPLLEAVENQCESAVQHLVMIADPNSSNNNGDTSLHRAASLPNTNILNCLITHGAAASVNIQNGLGFTPLHCAVFNQRYENVKALLAVTGIDVNMPRQCVDRFYRVVPIKTALSDSFAQYSANPLISQLLLKFKGININTKDERGRTPLMNAIMAYDAINGERWLDTMKALLAIKNIDIDIQDEDLCTALHHAVNSPSAVSMVKLLLAKRPKSINAENIEGKTALELARLLNKQEVATMIEAYFQH